jgi:hypothetical protein
MAFNLNLGGPPAYVPANNRAPGGPTIPLIGLARLTTALAACQNLMAGSNRPFILVGGLALVLLGMPEVGNETMFFWSDKEGEETFKQRAAGAAGAAGGFAVTRANTGLINGVTVNAGHGPVTINVNAHEDMNGHTDLVEIVNGGVTAGWTMLSYRIFIHRGMLRASKSRDAVVSLIDRSEGRWLMQNDLATVNWQAQHPQDAATWQAVLA